MARDPTPTGLTQGHKPRPPVGGEHQLIGVAIASVISLGVSWGSTRGCFGHPVLGMEAEGNPERSSRSTCWCGPFGPGS